MKKIDYKVGDYCVYNAHGVAKIQSINVEEFDGVKYKTYTLYLEKDRLQIDVPEKELKAEQGLVRKIVSDREMENVFGILCSGEKKLKGMWNRRAKEYEEKINSGDIYLLAEVVRDLTRDIEEEDRAFSERMIYENAVYRLSSEYAILKNISYEKAEEKIKEVASQRVKFVPLDECKIVKNA